jgi:hypothetical protein
MLTKRETLFIVAIGVGLLIGKLIKKMSVGLVLGVLLAVMAIMIFSKKR